MVVAAAVAGVAVVAVVAAGVEGDGEEGAVVAGGSPWHTTAEAGAALRAEGAGAPGAAVVAAAVRQGEGQQRATSGVVTAATGLSGMNRALLAKCSDGRRKV